MGGRRFRKTQKTPYGKAVKPKKPKPPQISPYAWVVLPKGEFLRSKDRKNLILSLLRSGKKAVDPGFWFALYPRDWFLSVLMKLREKDLEEEVVFIRADIRDRSVELVGKYDFSARSPSLIRPPKELVFYV